MQGYQIMLITNTFQDIQPYEQVNTTEPKTTTIARILRDTFVSGGILATLACQTAVASLPTYGLGYIETSDGTSYQYKNELESLQGYSFDHNQTTEISSYLKCRPLALFFLCGIKPLIGKVYQKTTVHKEIQLVSDPDTGEPLLELVLRTDLPIDDELAAKDRQLFIEIEKAGLVEGFRDVVLSNG